LKTASISLIIKDGLTVFYSAALENIENNKAANVVGNISAKLTGLMKIAAFY
jgi:hypothetical protein